MKRTLIISIFSFVVIDLFLASLLVFADTNQEHPSITHTSLSPTPSDTTTTITPQIKKSIKGLKLLKTERLKTGRSVKSVIFSPDQRYLYSLNLEGGSVYEFNRATRKLERSLIFKQTPAKGYNYKKHKWEKGSFAEKPVEGHFTHQGNYLWISLHNAAGVVAWNVKKNELITGKPFRVATLKEGKKEKKVNLHFFKTGKTPKVITSTKDGHYLFISNWHSHSITVLDIRGDDPSKWKEVKEIKIRPTPRGMCVSKDDKLLYVGLMGSDFIHSISLDSLKLLKKHTVGHNPRHLLNTGESIYLSLSKTESLLKLQQDSLKEEKRIKTKDDPRTISLSADKSLLAVGCYGDDVVQVFDAQSFKLLATVKSAGKPVGLDVFQNGDQVEVWVGNYTASRINVFSFKVLYEEETSKKDEDLTAKKE